MKEHLDHNSEPSMDQFMDMLDAEEKTWSEDALKRFEDVEEQVQSIIAKHSSTDSHAHLLELEAGGKHEIDTTSGYSTAQVEGEKQEYPHVTTETEVYDGNKKQ